MLAPVLLACCALHSPAEASRFRMPPLYSSNMVLQRGEPALFLGSGESGTRVTIEPGWQARRQRAGG
jgi:hypothetical protein